MDIEARKIAMVKQILNIENERFIKELEAKLIQLFPKYKSSLKHKNPLSGKQKPNNSTPPITEIRANVSLNVNADSKEELLFNLDSISLDSFL